MDNILFVSQISVSLLSIGRLTHLGYHVNFTPNLCIVQDPQTGVHIGIGHKNSGLYYRCYDPVHKSCMCLVMLSFLSISFILYS